MKPTKLCFLFRLSLAGLVFSGMSFAIQAVPGGKAQWISTSPQLTELLFQLNLGNQVVGTSDYSFYPKEAQSIRRIGRLFSPNLESILACGPSLVLWDSSSFDSDIDKYLGAMGIVSRKVELDSVEQVLTSAQDITDRYYFGKKSQQLIQAEMKWEKTKKNKKPFSFLALAWGDPPIIFGQKTFLFSLLEGVGGKGILPENWKDRYLKVSEEWVMAQKPEKVIFLKHDESTASRMLKQCDKWWTHGRARCVGLSANQFARASLTPLLFLDELLVNLEREK